MSDIIPPLISSTPPPMPEFDDDEDDDDDDNFGMGNGISDLGLDFQVPDAARESKDKILELERSGRVGSNGSQDGWRSNEEQDSASQDSGLCMASHDSEGVSPLPQSDDDERENGGGGELRHSATVIFDAAAQSNAVPVDTGQNESLPSDSKTDSSVVKKAKHDEDRSDDEFGNWTVAEDGDSFQFEKFATSNPPKESKDHEPSSLENATTSKSGLSNSIENSSDEIHLQDKSTAVSMNEKCVNSVNNCNLEACDVSSNCTFSQTTQFECEPSRSNDNCAENLSDSDDFGHFESVTVVKHNSECVDSPVMHYVETNTNLKAVDDDSFGDFSEFSEPVIVDSKPTRNEICENDSSVVEKVKEGSSLENNITSGESESVSLDKPLYQRSSENSTEAPLASRGRHAAADDDFNGVSDLTQSQAIKSSAAAATAATVDDCGGDDDEFDDFSDFTQSQAFESGTDQGKTDTFACRSRTIPSQSGFEDIFPKEGAETDDAKTEELEKGAIWQQLCPVESSPALTFQWPNSRAHTKLLSALNIDSRNILFGPKWNAKIPRFAANLGSNPLQPVKASERSSAIPATNNHPSDVIVQYEQETVPDAHFDWVGSGLTNPLDCAHRMTVKNAEEIGDTNSSRRRFNKLDNPKVLSSEAEKIISQLPDINFMKNTFIEVLISKV